MINLTTYEIDTKRWWRRGRPTAGKGFMVVSPKKRRLQSPFSWFGSTRSVSPLLPGLREKSFSAYPLKTKRSYARHVLKKPYLSFFKCLKLFNEVDSKTILSQFVKYVPQQSVNRPGLGRHQTYIPSSDPNHVPKKNHIRLSSGAAGTRY